MVIVKDGSPVRSRNIGFHSALITRAELGPVVCGQLLGGDPLQLGGAEGGQESPAKLHRLLEGASRGALGQSPLLEGRGEGEAALALRR